jgi:hypothetical protein
MMTSGSCATKCKSAACHIIRSSTSFELLCHFTVCPSLPATQCPRQLRLGCAAGSSGDREWLSSSQAALLEVVETGAHQGVAAAAVVLAEVEAEAAPRRSRPTSIRLRTHASASSLQATSCRSWRQAFVFSQLLA